MALFRQIKISGFSYGTTHFKSIYTSNLYMIPECAYAVDANTLFERCLYNYL
ncbi:MAG: hypothetical protein QXK37_04945 [Candidatus Woesearchaeota archaeon]